MAVDPAAAELERLQQRNVSIDLSVYEACGRLQAGIEFAIDWLEGSRPMTSRAEAAEFLRGLLDRAKETTKL